MLAVLGCGPPIPGVDATSSDASDAPYASGAGMPVVVDVARRDLPSDACDVGPDPNVAELAGSSPLGAFAFAHSWFGLGGDGGCTGSVRLVALTDGAELAGLVDAERTLGLDAFSAGIEIQIPVIGEGLAPGSWPAHLFHRTDGRTATTDVIVAVLSADATASAGGSIAATIETSKREWDVHGSLMARYCAVLTADGC